MKKIELFWSTQRKEKYDTTAGINGFILLLCQFLSLLITFLSFKIMCLVQIYAA